MSISLYCTVELTSNLSNGIKVPVEQCHIAVASCLSSRKGRQNGSARLLVQNMGALFRLYDRKAEGGGQRAAAVVPESDHLLGVVGNSGGWLCLKGPAIGRQVGDEHSCGGPSRSGGGVSHALCLHGVGDCGRFIVGLIFLIATKKVQWTVEEL